MFICFKQHLTNIWSSIHEKIKEHWGRVFKKALLIKIGMYIYEIRFSDYINLVLVNPLSDNSSKWSNTLNNLSGKANELLVGVWPFCGV